MHSQKTVSLFGTKITVKYCRYNSCSTGHKKVELRQIPHEEFFNPLKYFISGGKVLVGVYGSFSYTEKQTNCYSMICNPKELNEKLLEKLPSDFDIFVGNEKIKVNKKISEIKITSD
uniref:LAGLIDADG homing endonuclease n=1 Tax=Panagrolaimus davidi TaxID=227884 RepID=A0A914QKI8_9BILA